MSTEFYPSLKDVERFWSYVNKTDGCWFWTGSLRSGQGNYGQFELQGHPVRAHMLSYFLSKGPIADGMQVCHTCDNHPCVNPDHLFEGTNFDNMHDASVKGRIAKPLAKLTADQVRSIRERYGEVGKPRTKDQVTMRQLCEEYDTWRGTIRDILYRRTWKDI